MEKLRKLERSCLRSIFCKYRQENSKLFISNTKLYNIANIPRIDNYIIQISRDYYNNLKSNPNKIINQFTITPDIIAINSAHTNYIPPESFVYFDKIGIIQNENNIPTIYHISRHRANKSIPDNFESFHPIPLIYFTSIPNHDHDDFTRINYNYWWLHKDAKHLDDLRLRKRHKLKL